MSAIKTSSGNMHPGCLMLFGLPFLAAGTGIFIWGILSWSVYLASDSWQPTPATVGNVEWIKNSGDSDSGPTYAVGAEYTYEFEGRTYTNDRVSVMGGASSEYDLHRRRYNELLEHQRTGKPFTALVNPEEASEAILYRELDTWMIIIVPFGLVFAGAGVGLMGYGVWSMVKSRRLRSFMEQQGDRYWLMRDDWRSMRVRASNLKQLASTWGMGIALSVFMSMFVVAIGRDPDTPFFAKAIVGLFTLFAVSAVVWAIALTIRQLVYGTPILHLAEVPIVPGRTVAAAVRCRRAIGAERWDIDLTCVESHWETRRSGGKTSRSQVKNTLFEQELQPAGEPRAGRERGMMIPVQISIPEGERGTNLHDEKKIEWQLNVKARVLPWPFSAAFELPVFYADEDEIRQAVD